MQQYGLTEKQLKLFKFIKNYITKNKISPSYEEMKVAIGLKSKCSIFRRIQQLKDRGQQAVEDFFAAREAAKAAEVARIARQQLAASMGSDAGPGEGAGTFGASINEATGARGSGTGFSNYS